jgi:deoxyadenosine kinase
MFSTNDRLFIPLCGIIGAGKSTLAVKLSEIMGLPLYKESVADHPMLADFYDNMPEYAFPLQVSLLTQRCAQQQKITWNGKGAIQDRSIYEDPIFAKKLADDGIMKKEFYEEYNKLFSIMSKFLQHPSFIIYLYVTPDIAYRRMKKRNRKIEQNLPKEYIESLFKYYEEFIISISTKIPVIKIDWNKDEPDDEEITKIAEAIKCEILSKKIRTVSLQ